MNNQNKQEGNNFEIADTVASSTSEDVRELIINPRAYLDQFYAREVDTGNRALMRFYAKAYQDIRGRSLLEFGGGPTIYSIITAARTAGWIHFCDYNAQCLSEVNKWLIKDSSAFDWSHFTNYALSCENRSQEKPSQEDVQARHRLIRQCIHKLSRCDIFADDPLLGSSMGPYGAVANTFCLDSIIHDKKEWFHLNQKLANLVDKDGFFITVSLLNASYWPVGSARYPAVSLTPTDMTNMYSELGFNITYSDVVDGLEGKLGYSGFIMTCGKRQ